MEVNIDLMANGQADGDFASRLLAGGSFNAGAMRPFIDQKTGKAYISVYQGGDRSKPENFKTMQVNAATLRRDEWLALDEVLIPIAQNRLVGINDLLARGLTYKLTEALGTMILTSEQGSDAFQAEISMDGAVKSRNDRQQFKAQYTPIPIIHVDYTIGERVMIASRKLGNPLDVSQAALAARKVAEKLESLLFTDTTYAFGNGNIYSYLNFPHRNLETISNWADLTVTAKTIVEEVQGLKQASMDKNFYGPWVLYVSANFETRLDSDYDTSGQSTQTIRDRILKINGITDIKVIDTMPTSNVVLVQMTPDVVRLIDGLPLTNIQEKADFGFTNNFKVMTIRVPEIRADYDGKTGIVHGSVSGGGS